MTWEDATRFCKWLSAREGRNYRLPTEREWEYACRAGSQTRFCFGDDPDFLPVFAWCKANGGYRPHPVGTRQPNSWGFYDMHGNVKEWCMDWYGPYPGESAADYGGREPPPANTLRILRGGDIFTVGGCRCAVRRGLGPAEKSPTAGFRVVCELRD